MNKYVNESTCMVRYNDLKSDLTEIKDIVKNLRDNHIEHLSKDTETMKVYFKIMGVALGIIIPIVATILIKVYLG